MRPSHDTVPALPCPGGDKPGANLDKFFQRANLEVRACRLCWGTNAGRARITQTVQSTAFTATACWSGGERRRALRKVLCRRAEPREAAEERTLSPQIVIQSCRCRLLLLGHGHGICPTLHAFPPASNGLEAAWPSDAPSGLSIKSRQKSGAFTLLRARCA